MVSLVSTDTKMPFPVFCRDTDVNPDGKAGRTQFYVWRVKVAFESLDRHQIRLHKSFAFRNLAELPLPEIRDNPKLSSEIIAK